MSEKKYVKEIEKLRHEIAKRDVRIAQLEHARDSYKSMTVEQESCQKIMKMILPTELNIETAKMDKFEAAMKKVPEETKKEIYFGPVMATGGYSYWYDGIREQVAALTGTPVKDVDLKRSSYIITGRGAEQCPDCLKATVLTLRQAKFGGEAKYATKWHPNTWYISCGCEDNAEKHYRTPFEALAGWNAYVQHEWKMRARKAKKEEQQRKLDAYLGAQERKGGQA